MRPPQLSPDVIGYNAATSACQRGPQWERALGALREMAQVHLEADLISYDTAMSACEKSQRWERAV